MFWHESNEKYVTQCLLTDKKRKVEGTSKKEGRREGSEERKYDGIWTKE